MWDAGSGVPVTPPLRPLPWEPGEPKRISSWALLGGLEALTWLLP